MILLFSKAFCLNRSEIIWFLLVSLLELPYVGKRIKQNLKDIDFNDDSEEDEDWTKDPQHKSTSSRSVLKSTPTNLRTNRPKRQVAPNLFPFNSHDSSNTLHRRSPGVTPRG